MTDELEAHRLVSPVPLPPECPATTARVKGGLRPSQAIEPLYPQDALTGHLNPHDHQRFASQTASRRTLGPRRYSVVV